MDVSVVTITVVFWMCIIELILIPIMTFMIYNYWKSRKHPSIYHRNYRLALLTAVCGTLWIGVERVFGYVQFIINTDLYYQIACVLWAVCTYPFLVLITLQMWMVFYKINLLQSLEKSVWKHIINPTGESWFLNNITKYGNLQYVGVRVMVVCILLIIAYITTHIYLPSDSIFIVLYELLFLAIPGTIIISIIRWKTPKYNDVFGIRHESSICIKFCVLQIIITSVINSIQITIVSNKIYWILEFIDDSFIVFLIFTIVFVQTYLPVRRIKSKNILSNLKIVVNNAANLNHSPTDSNNNDPFLKIFENNIFFQAFIVHVQHEFSIENVVGYIEFYQLAHFVLPSITDDDTKNVFFNGYLSLPDVPKSAILYNSNISFNKKLLFLYKKYIEVHCGLELNLSFLIRNEWKIFIDKLPFELNENTNIQTAEKQFSIPNGLFRVNELSNHSKSVSNPMSIVNHNKCIPELDNNFANKLIKLICDILTTCDNLMRDSFSRFDGSRVVNIRNNDMQNTMNELTI